MSHSVVIGGAGFVGSWVVEEILKNPDAQVTIVDNLISSEKWNISTDSRITFIEGSAADISTFKGISRNVDFVFQLACFHGNQSSMARPLDDLENSLKTTLATLEWVRNYCPNARVIYSGAGCAVAEKTWDSPIPVTELEVTSLFHDSPYSISKITGEMHCLYYSKQHNLDVVRTRFQNIYGPREILGAGIWRGTENTIWRNVIPTFIWRALNNLEISIYGNAETSRDFVYVEDAARGIIQASKLGTPGGVYNIGSGKETFISDVAKKIIDLTKSRSTIINKTKRDWDNSGRRKGSTIKSTLELDFTTRISIDEGLSQTIAWTISNFDNINLTMKKHIHI